jgi:hypothetical protein
MFDFQNIDAVVSQISTEKKIDKSRLLEIIESAIKTAYKRDYANKEANVNVHIDTKK